MVMVSTPPATVRTSPKLAMKDLDLVLAHLVRNPSATATPALADAANNLEFLSAEELLDVQAFIDISFQHCWKLVTSPEQAIKNLDLALAHRVRNPLAPATMTALADAANNPEYMSGEGLFEVMAALVHIKARCIKLEKLAVAALEESARAIRH